MRVVPMVVVLLLASGCIGVGEENGDVEPTAAPETTGSTNGTVETKTVERAYSGILLYRIAGEGPTWNFVGDPPGFCFVAPNGTERIEGHLEWTPSQQMGLEFHPPEGDRTTSWNGNLAEAMTTVQPPIDLAVDAEQAGTWYAYAGPGVAGGPVNWTLTLTLTVPVDAQPSDTVYDGDPCETPPPVQPLATATDPMDAEPVG